MRSLPVVITLSGPAYDLVVDEAGSESGRLRIEQELSELVADCGVVARPEVRFAFTSDPMRGQPVRVSVDGRLCLVPQRTSAEALAYATRSWAVGAGLTPENILGDGIRAVDVHETLALVARAAVSARSEVLVAADDPLAALLGFGVSIAGEDPDALRDSVRSGETETTLDRLAAPTLDLYIEPRYLQSLTMDHNVAELFTFVSDSMFAELGVVLPPMHVHLDQTLCSGGFAFRVNAIRTIPRVGLSLDSIFVNGTPESLSLLGVQAVVSVNPATNQPGSIAPAAARTMLEAAGFTVWDAFGYFILVLADVIRTHAPMLTSLARVHEMLGGLGQAFPAVTAGLDDSEVVQVLCPLLRSLLVEQVSTRNLRKILHLIRCHDVAPEVTFELDLLAFVRRGLAEQIAYAIARGTDTLAVYLLDMNLERQLADCASRADTIESDLAEALRDAFYAEMAHQSTAPTMPPVLTDHRCRVVVRDILRAEFPSVRVLSYQDLPAHFHVHPVAQVSP